jgi:hypothetical protein
LRWATLKRTSQTFIPSFTLQLSGHTLEYVAPESEYYCPTDYEGSQLAGQLRIALSSGAGSSTAFLRATYVPRYITRMSFRAESTYSFDVALVSAADGGLCDPASWNLTITDAQQGGKAILVESTDPDDFETGLPYAAFGPILKFDFDTDIDDPAEAFTAFEVDNTIYGGGQTFNLVWPPLS